MSFCCTLENKQNPSHVSAKPNAVKTFLLDKVRFSLPPSPHRSDRCLKPPSLRLKSSSAEKTAKFSEIQSIQTSWVLPLRGANPKPKSRSFIWKLHLLSHRYQGIFLESAFPSHTASSLTIHMSRLCQVNDRIWRDQSSFHKAPAVVQQGFGAAFIQHSPSRKPHSGAAWFLRAGICLSPNHEFKSRFSRKKQRISLCPCCSFQGPGPSPSPWAHRGRHFKYPSIMELDNWEIPAPSLQQGTLQVRKEIIWGRVVWVELGFRWCWLKGSHEPVSFYLSNTLHQLRGRCLTEVSSAHGTNPGIRFVLPPFQAKLQQQDM